MWGTLSQPPLISSWSAPTFASTRDAEAEKTTTLLKNGPDKTMFRNSANQALLSTSLTLPHRTPKYKTMAKGPWGKAPVTNYGVEHKLRWNSLGDEKGEPRVGEEPLVLEKKMSALNLRTRTQVRLEMEAALRKRTSLFLPFPMCARDLSFMQENRTKHFMGGETIERWRLTLQQHGNFVLVLEVVEDPFVGNTKRSAYEGIYGPLGFSGGKAPGNMELDFPGVGGMVAHLELQSYLFETGEVRWDPTSGYRSADPRGEQELNVPTEIHRCKTQFKVTLMPPADPQECEVAPLHDAPSTPWPTPLGDVLTDLSIHNCGPRAVENQGAYQGWRPLVMRRVRPHCWNYPDAGMPRIGGLGSTKGGLSRSQMPADFTGLGARSPMRREDQWMSPGLHSVWSRTKREGMCAGRDGQY